MPRVSVVVPIYNVESYLAACLDSLANQTLEDLEVVMVDDGSTDRSGDIAEEYARRDKRFKLVTQANGGLSKARNTGIDVATGEFLAFVDSDDLLPRNALARLVGTLEKTGSQIASGNVLRLNGGQTSQARFLARAFAETRLKTHVTKFRPLLADRTAWNKVWRRSFWDEHGFRFPEGVVHEDIPVTLPAHFLASTVDVLADTVYLWRMRETGGDLSITQRRLEQRTLIDRLAAIEKVREFLKRHGSRKARRWYDASVVADDLKLHLNVLDNADEDYQALFMERAAAFLDSAPRNVEGQLAAIDRLKWHLVRRRLLPELIEVIRFEKERLDTTPPVKVGGRWYGDYPFREDPRLKIPRAVYRLNIELSLSAHLEELRRDGDELRVSGYAYIDGIGAPAEGSQRIALVALKPGRLRRVRLRTTAVGLQTASRHRPDATARSRQPLADVSWSGFEATLGPGRLRGEGTWELYAHVVAGGISRRRVRFALESPRPFTAVELPASGDARITAAVNDANGVDVGVRSEWLVVRSGRTGDDGALELEGEVRMPPARRPKLQVRRERDGHTLSFPLVLDDPEKPRTFTASVSLADMLAAKPAPAGGVPGEDDDRMPWELWVAGGGRRIPVELDRGAAGAVWRSAAREVALVPTPRGRAALVERDPRAVLEHPRWEDGVLELGGTLPAGPEEWRELALADADRGERHAFPLDAAGGRFTARVTPARIETLAGVLPLRAGTWHVELLAATGEVAPAVPAEELLDALPLATTLDRKPFALGVADDRAVLSVQRDLDNDERGPFHQRRLAESVYPTLRREPLRDAVVYSSFGGTRYADSPRAIHEELVRRGSPLEHVWVVDDGRCRVPEGATVVREGSHEHYEAMARARYVIANDHFPEWFSRRPDQTCLQTWHGTPLQRLGLDAVDPRALPRFERRWSQRLANWQYVVSPNRFSTPILRRAFVIEGEILETGYPRVDVLARPDRDGLAARVRARLGLPEGTRTVLYAPTYRRHVVDRRGRFRLELKLDFERLREALGEDTVILFRKHHYIADAAPSTPDGFVRDVSTYPDDSELLLAADVLVTDYSSTMFDFANTGRPMIFFTYDLDAWREEVSSFYLDFAGTVPGPLAATTDEVAEALLDTEAVQAAFAGRYREFRSTFCELDDGGAAARVVDRVLAG